MRSVAKKITAHPLRHFRNEALIRFGELIREVDVIPIDEHVVDTAPLHRREHFHEGMQDARRKLVREGAVSLAVARESAEDVRGDIGLRVDVEPRRADVALDLRLVCHRAEIGIEKFSAAPQNAMDRTEERLLSRITMRGFHVDDRVEMVFREVERLRVAGAEVNAERAVRFAVVRDGVLILVNGCVRLRLVITFDE